MRQTQASISIKFSGGRGTAASVPPALEVLARTRFGRLQVLLPDGARAQFRGKMDGPAAEVSFRDWKSLNHIVAAGDVALGEDYMRGLWDTPDLGALMDFAFANAEVFDAAITGNRLTRFARSVRRSLLPNTPARSLRNVQKHDNLGNEFYRLWLDEGMTWSSALFRGDASRRLEEAQEAKYRRILTRLRVKPGDSILELGCGWGGFMEAAAQVGCRVTGVTLSGAQQAWAEERLRGHELAGRTEVLLDDHRNIGGAYDHVVSIGMFEHIGEKHWDGYMETLAARLKPGSRAVIETVVLRDDLFDNYRRGTDFLREHVFPGGLPPTQRSFTQTATAAGLRVTDIFRFGRDYALTLEKWRGRFEARLDDVRRLGCDEEFVRKWRFYLASCAAAFRAGRVDVMQAELENPAAAR